MSTRLWRSRYVLHAEPINEVFSLDPSHLSAHSWVRTQSTGQTKVATPFDVQLLLNLGPRVQDKIWNYVRTRSTSETGNIYSKHNVFQLRF